MAGVGIGGQVACGDERLSSCAMTRSVDGSARRGVLASCVRFPDYGVITQLACVPRSVSDYGVITHDAAASKGDWAGDGGGANPVISEPDRKVVRVPVHAASSRPSPPSDCGAQSPRRRAVTALGPSPSSVAEHTWNATCSSSGPRSRPFDRRRPAASHPRGVGCQAHVPGVRTGSRFALGRPLRTGARRGEHDNDWAHCGVLAFLRQAQLADYGVITRAHHHDAGAVDRRG